MAFGQTQTSVPGTGTAAAPVTPQNTLLGFMPLVLIFVIFYFLLILPQQRKQKKQQAMIDSLKSGDEVVTLGGLFGKIVEAKAETFVLEIANNTKVKISRAAISHKVQ
ncbi:MAG: preprotein translocase subunit YajC [Candidatus Omnitrophica bacterium]|nr:preprotein translocase subunit YajC [Candidatus Omnitrophota bacterium]